MLEEKIEALTEAVLALIDSMGNGADTPNKKEAPAKKATKKAPARRGKKKEPEGPTLATVRDAVRKVKAETGSMKEVKVLLGEFDCKAVGDLEESDYAEFIEGCTEIIEGAGGDDDEDEDEDDI